MQALEKLTLATKVSKDKTIVCLLQRSWNWNHHHHHLIQQTHCCLNKAGCTIRIKLYAFTSAAWKYDQLTETKACEMDHVCGVDLLDDTQCELAQFSWVSWSDIHQKSESCLLQKKYDDFWVQLLGVPGMGNECIKLSTILMYFVDFFIICLMS